MGMNVARVQALARQLSLQLADVDHLVSQLSTTKKVVFSPQSHGFITGDMMIAPWTVTSLSGAATELTAARGAIVGLLDDLAREISAQQAASAGVGGTAKLMGSMKKKKGEGSTTLDGRYTIGDRTQPDYEWDEGFIYNSQSAGPGDFASAAKWKAQAAGARVVRWDLKDGLDAYDHYWSNTGDPWVFNYQSAYDSDASVRTNVDNEIARAQLAAEELAVFGGSSFSFTGKASSSEAYPVTENWQKAIGGYQQWSSGDVTVKGNQITMTVTVTADDHYNFNPGQADIASGSSDDENGRFTEIGWAKPFDSSGSVTRTITWTTGNPGGATIVEKPSER